VENEKKFRPGTSNCESKAKVLVCAVAAGLVAALAMVACNWKDRADTCVEERSDGNVCITDDLSLHVSLSTNWLIPSSVCNLG
jgi:hypothetical protein